MNKRIAFRLPAPSLRGRAGGEAAKFLLLILTLCAQALNAVAQHKREFRGAWIQCVNGQFQGMSTAKMQETLTYQLNVLQRQGVNAIIFQVRAECDALYPSPYEPWSRFLTGVQGRAPQPYWDPLQWMITECHKRGMELHAWINPFRAKTKSTAVLANTHVASRNPGAAFMYDNQLILNPAYQWNRDYICTVAADIVRRYDIDGFHIDDYFYPYPIEGQIIPDDRDFAAYNNGIANKGDWRRFNVNQFIKQLSDSIHNVKPWVKFGVSPFGIYRNKRNDPYNGSETAGLQNYDDLYADVMLWVNNGWIDYCVPQIYWQIGHPTADYQTLIQWWNRYCSQRPLYVGEDIERTVKFADPRDGNKHQMEAKYRLRNQMRNVHGTVLWYAKAAVDNVGNYGTMLEKNYWRYPALQPRMPFIDNRAPSKVHNLGTIWTEDGYMLVWEGPTSRNWRDAPYKYVVYCFEKGEFIDIEDPSHIVAITRTPYYRLPYRNGRTKYVYVVTALDRMSNESTITKKKVKL